MDLFKQNLAPIPSEAWEEINGRAAEVIKSFLTARRVLHVEGPLGMAKASVSLGRLDVIKEKNTIEAGYYKVKPLLETRARFDLNRWELDDVVRGAKDIDLDALEQAAEKLALYEEDTIYNGNKEAKIKGLVELSKHKKSVDKDANSILQAVSEIMLKLKDAYADGPYYMIVGDDMYNALSQEHGGKLLHTLIKTLIGGEIIRSKVLTGAILLPYNHPDLQLVIGQDYKVGYTSSTNKEVSFFIINAFIPYIIDKALLAHITLE